MRLTPHCKLVSRTRLQNLVSMRLSQQFKKIEFFGDPWNCIQQIKPDSGKVRRTRKDQSVKQHCLISLQLRKYT